MDLQRRTLLLISHAQALGSSAYKIVWRLIRTQFALAMADSSTTTLALTDSPHIYLGFWHSYGNSFPQGAVLTISRFWFMTLSSMVTLFIAWTLSRAWRIFGALIFQSIHHQNQVIIARSQYACPYCQ
jgi:hypothetical protein